MTPKLSDSDDELSSLIFDWASEAARIVEQNFNFVTKSYTGVPKWVIDSSGNFELAFAYQSLCSELLQPYLEKHCISWETLANFATINNTNWWKLSQFSQPEDFHKYIKRFCFRLLPDSNKFCSDLWSEGQLKPKIQKAVRSLHLKSDCVNIFPIYGIYTLDKIILDTEFEFSALEIDDKLECLNRQFIQADYGHRISKTNQNWFGFKKHTTSSALNSRRESLYDKKELFVALSNLITGGHGQDLSSYIHHPVISYEVNGNVIQTSSFGFDSKIPTFNFPTYQLNDEEITAIKKAWEILSPDNIKDYKAAVKNAVIRIYSAKRRFSDLDKVVDYMIAAESIFLDDKSELNFRLKLHAANWTDGDKASKKAIFELYGDFYRLRSNVVHGAVGNLSSLSERLPELEKNLREAALKAINHLYSTDSHPVWRDSYFA